MSNINEHALDPALIVATATASNVTPEHAFPDPGLPGSPVLKYGQDITFGANRAAPKGHNVGTTVDVLIPKMEKLVPIFASEDKSGMAARLVAQFTAKQDKVTYFDDLDLYAAAAKHENIVDFCGRVLCAPHTPQFNPKKTRIHQALKQANWDIKKLQPLTDLGAPAFNKGNKYARTGDFANGLGLMVNGVQHVYVVATHYFADQKKKRYQIYLKYAFYDVFGLDDTDLERFGAMKDGFGHPDAAVGITAWWQLQHQHRYAPLVVRIIVDVFSDVLMV